MPSETYQSLVQKILDDPNYAEQLRPIVQAAVGGRRATLEEREAAVAAMNQLEALFEFTEEDLLALGIVDGDRAWLNLCGRTKTPTRTACLTFVTILPVPVATPNQTGQ